MARAAAALAVLPVLACGAPVGADTAAGDGEDALYPAAQCAALWFGYDDYARWSAYLDRTPGDLDRARAFREVAYRLNDGETGPVDAYVAQQRRLMAVMIEAMIYGGDRQSRDLFERLTRTCEEFAAEHPETKALR